MNANSLPVPTATSGAPSQSAAAKLSNAPGAAPAAAPAAVADTAEASGDFVGMLMQLLGGSAPAATVAVTATRPLVTQELAADTDSEDAAELAALLAVPVVMPLPWAAQPAPLTGDGADPLEMLGLMTSGGKQGAQVLLDLKTELAETMAEPGLDVGGERNDVGALSPFTDALKTGANQADTVASRALHSPVGTSQWADELGTKMTWMVDRGQQAASLKLSPEHLGPLEVRISINDDKASVWFGAAHADTRAAIENALPRLREMLASQGLSLTDAGVFREPPREQPAFTPARNSFGTDPDSTASEGEVMISARGIGILDAYA